MTKRWGFRFAAAVAVPLLSLLIVEGVLRVAGYGEDRSYLVSAEYAGEAVWRDNPAFFDLFFPKQLRPVQLPFSVPKRKADDEVRIVLLGGSAAMGIPDAAFGMGPMLEELLQYRHSDFEINVLNLANTAINSHVVREIAREALDLEPDAIVVYLGNNEVVGPYGAGTVFTPLAPPRAAIRASIAVQRTRLGQLISSVFRRGPAADAPSQWRGMEMFLDQQVTEDDPKLSRVYDHFRANLGAICEIAARRNIPVVLSSVATNLLHSAPFASESLDSVKDLLGAARSLRMQGDLTGARAKVEEAVAKAPECADAHYRLGRLALALGDTIRGREELVRARDLDTLRFRADSKIEQIIAEVAAARRDQGVVFVDIADTLAADSPFGVSGREYLLEHVHFDLLGNHRVARALVPVLESVLAQSRRNGFASDAPAERPHLGAMAAAQYLAYTPWTRARLIQQILAMQERPPFLGQSNHAEQLTRLRSEFDRLTEQVSKMEAKSLWPVYELSMQRHPEQWIRRFQAALFLQEGLGDPARAEPLWRELTHRLPHFPAAWNSLAQSVAAQGRKSEARQLLERSLDLQPYQPEMQRNLANLERELTRR